MRYDVTFQVDGNERTESVDAPDAASAVSSVQAEHSHTPELFELIQVHLVDDPHGHPTGDQVQVGATD